MTTNVHQDTNRSKTLDNASFTTSIHRIDIPLLSGTSQLLKAFIFTFLGCHQVTTDKFPAERVRQTFSPGFPGPPCGPIIPGGP